MWHRAGLFLLAFSCSIWIWDGNGKAQGSCSMYPPVAEVTGIQWYKDEKGSVVDAHKFAENLRLQKNLRNFTDSLAALVDQVIEGKRDVEVIDCVQRNLAAWADAGALLSTPTWGVQVAEQLKAIIAIQFIFLKLEAMSIPTPLNVQRWRQSSLSALLKATTRSNLHVWSGVAAAAGDLLKRDSSLRRYHDAVWNAAIIAIASDGTVAAEMDRGQRALIYHTFYYNAVAALWSLRNALEIDAKPSDLEAIRRLSKVVGFGACQPLEFAQRAGAKQEPLDRWNVAMAAAFASRFNTSEWVRCTEEAGQFFGAGWGGRFDLTVKSLEAVGKLTK